MATGAIRAVSLLLVLFTAATVSTASNLRSAKASDDDDTCVYTFYIKTGTINKAGTDSIISVKLAGSDGQGVQITDLVDWGGQMGQNYNYFESGNLDTFSGRGPCHSTPLCGLNLTSDGSGAFPGWYCMYVEVTTTGPHLGCSHVLFSIDQWLAIDRAPNQLYATRDNCSTDGEGVIKGPRLPRAAEVGRREKAEME